MEIWNDTGARPVHLHGRRPGNLDEAVQVIGYMDAKPDGRIWDALLASCPSSSGTDGIVTR